MEELSSNGNDFSKELSPFGEAEAAAATANGEEADPFSSSVGYLYPEATTILTPQQKQKQKQKQKLRPIRSNNRSEALLTVTGSELGFQPLEEQFNNLNHQHYSHLCGGSLSEGESESSWEERKARRKRRRKRKMEEYVKEMMGQVMEKQEQMQQQLMEVIEKKEKERVGREEAWRQQESLRLHQQHQIRSQEAARSLALISFLRNALGLPLTP